MFVYQYVYNYFSVIVVEGSNCYKGYMFGKFYIILCLVYKKKNLLILYFRNGKGMIYELGREY